MAGGMILIVVLVLTMPVPSAMILHGLVQSMANGSRYWFLRQHTAWRVLPGYLIGTVLSVCVFVSFTLVVDAAIVLIIAGALPWISQFTPERFRLDVTKPAIAVICGVVTTSAQLLAGASGPILDAFYQRAPLNRFEIVATKALTQVIGHVVKTAYYLFVSAVVLPQSDEFLSWWFILIAITLSLLATKLGTLMLARMSEGSFQTWTTRLLLGLGLVVVCTGVWQLAK